MDAFQKSVVQSHPGWEESIANYDFETKDIPHSPWYDDEKDHLSRNKVGVKNGK